MRIPTAGYFTARAFQVPQLFHSQLASVSCSIMTRRHERLSLPRYTPSVNVWACQCFLYRLLHGTLWHIPDVIDCQAHNFLRSQDRPATASVAMACLAFLLVGMHGHPRLWEAMEAERQWLTRLTRTTELLYRVGRPTF